MSGILSPRLQKKSGLQDDWRFYCERAAATKPLSREDELALANEIVAKRQEWRRAVLSNNFGQQCALEHYRTASTADPRAMMRIVQRTKKEGHETVRRDLSALLPQIRALVGQNTQNARERIQKLLEGQTPAQAHDSETDEVLRLMEIRKLTHAKLEEVMGDMERLLASLEAYEAQWNTPKECLELITLISRNVVWPEQFRQTVAQLKQDHSAWQAARQEMVLANTRLVISIAKRYRNRGLDFSDLLSQGNIGLMRAVDEFALEHECRFITYAPWWVRQSIMKGLTDQANTIRIPADNIETLANIRTFSKQYAEENNGQQPSEGIISQALELAPVTVRNIILASQRTASLDTVVGESADSLENFLSDRKAPNPLAEASAGEKLEAIMEALRSLPPKERQIIILRFGLGLRELPPTQDDPTVRFEFDEETYGVPLDLDEVGRKLGMTKERVRQLEGVALKKLGNSDHPLRYSMATHQENGGQPERVESLAEENGDRRLRLCLTEIGVPTNITNALEQQGVYTVGDYLRLTEEASIGFPYFRKKSLQSVDTALASLGLSNLRRLNNKYVGSAHS